MNSDLADALDLAVQVDRDADQLPAELHRRERLLLTKAGAVPAAPRARLQAWLGALRDQPEALPGTRVAAGYRLLVIGLALAGTLLGCTAASVVFRYDGTRPVNVVHVLAVLVLPQVALLGLLGPVMLPRSWLKRIPGAVALQESLAALSPGRVVRVLLRRLPERLRALAARLDTPSPLTAFGRIWKWATLFAAQAFAVAFNAGAALTALYLVTFSDLAFAWSTTLTPEVSRVHRITSFVAAPWGRFLPKALPSEELIRATLYYRAETVATGGPRGPWGGWWPFLLAALVTYGVLPRFLLLLGTGLRLRRLLRQALVSSPAAVAVLERLDSRWVTTQATEPEAEGTPAPARDTPPSPDAFSGSHGLILINWAGLDLDDQTLRAEAGRRWNRDVAGVHHAGGCSSLAEEERTISSLARTGPELALVVLVKGWEPPLLEFLDFLKALRRACGPGRKIVVVPLGLASPGGLSPSPPAHAAVWRRKIRSLSDPGLRLDDWPETQGTPP